MTDKKVSGKAQGAKRDAAEAWLAQNDPEYNEQKKGWIAPTTDALSRINSEINETHYSLKDWVPIEPREGGNYYRRRSNAEEERSFEYSDASETDD